MSGGLLGQRCINTVWKSDKVEFLQRCTFSAVDQDPLLTHIEQVCHALCLYDFNMLHCPQLAGELLTN